MSRRRRKHRNPQQQSNGNNNSQKKAKKNICSTYIVPLDEWKKFQRFKEYFPRIEEALSDLQETWNNQLSDTSLSDDEGTLIVPSSTSEEIHDHIIRLTSLVDGTLSKSRNEKYRKPKPTSFVSNRPPKKPTNGSNWYAEIIVEDVSDGKI